MPCRELSSWTFTDLAEAFLDLSIAFLLLCASALVFWTAKLLGVLGLYLPCPCDGRFSGRSRFRCCQKILKDVPLQRICTVHGSVMKKAPFNSVISHNRSLLLRKGFAVRKMSYAFKRHRKVVPDHGKLSSASIFHCPELYLHDTYTSGDKKLGNRNLGRTIPFKVEDDGQAVGDIVGYQGLSSASDGSDNNGKNIPNEFASQIEEMELEASKDQGIDVTAWSRIRGLEQTLKRLQTAHAALCLELEKERNAAASAADEAMAVILRLQEEKASIEMEARQYQRMIEEKSAFDAEEMNILKEILLRREREKHFLEKEVEAYRQMFLENEQLELHSLERADKSSARTSVLCSDENPKPVLHQITESVDGMEPEENGVDFAESVVSLTCTENSTFALGDELGVAKVDGGVDYSILRNACHDSFALPGMEDEEVEDHLKSTRFATDGIKLPERTIVHFREKKLKSGKEYLGQNCALPNISKPKDDSKLEKPEEDSPVIRFDPDRVHDTHGICHEVRLSKEENASKENSLRKNNALKNPRLDDAASRSRNDFELDRSRSISSIPQKLRLACPPDKTFSSDMRRKSMSAVDHERLKIENELGLLCGRLEVVQQGRENLNLVVGQRRREHSQSQNSKSLAKPLHGNKQFGAAGWLMHEASFPQAIPKARVISKSSRRQSAPLDLYSA